MRMSASSNLTPNCWYSMCSLTETGRRTTLRSNILVSIVIDNLGRVHVHKIAVGDDSRHEFMDTRIEALISMSWMRCSFNSDLN
ncbi:hypothetical protein E2C01_027797 [Portunus trituberculatus]|uniref:Uncharacterized protein n=1 Tax=Portunus trituberculatus TaxID=210409 RepID=A0A5B7EIT6_PORTR|nr:hypothetical protein [Portunus trituberculatus]